MLIWVVALLEAATNDPLSNSHYEVPTRFFRFGSHALGFR